MLGERTTSLSYFEELQLIFSAAPISPPLPFYIFLGGKWMEGLLLGPLAITIVSHLSPFLPNSTPPFPHPGKLSFFSEVFPRNPRGLFISVHLQSLLTIWEFLQSLSLTLWAAELNSANDKNKQNILPAHPNSCSPITLSNPQGIRWAY